MVFNTVSNVSIQPKSPFKGERPQQAESTRPAPAGHENPPVRHPIASVHFQALAAPQIRRVEAPKFGHILTDNDYLITHRVRTPVNAYAASKTLRAQILRDMVKREQEDKSNLKYCLSAYASYWNTDEAALADNLILADRDVDTVIQGHAGPASVMALMMTRMMNGTGRRYMSKDATLNLGPVEMGLSGKNHDQQIRRELNNESLRDKESLVMLASGETDRKKVNDYLNSGVDFNALESLAFGKHGLVDAILVGRDKVLTREGLEKFYAAKKFTPEQIAAFNKDPLNVDQITNNVTFQKFLMPLAEYSPAAIVSEKAQQDDARPSQYLSAEEQDILKPELEGGSSQQLSAIKHVTADRMQVIARPIDSPGFNGMNRLPFLNARIGASPATRRLPARREPTGWSTITPMAWRHPPRSMPLRWPKPADGIWTRC
jgi:hypothetical protein